MWAAGKQSCVAWWDDTKSATGLTDTCVRGTPGWSMWHECVGMRCPSSALVGRFSFTGVAGLHVGCPFPTSLGHLKVLPGQTPELYI